MVKKHRKWTALIGYFNEIPLSLSDKEKINILLKRNKNILILIKKEDINSNPKYTDKEKFKSICDEYPEQTKTGKIIISSVPDINEIIYEKITFSKLFMNLFKNSRLSIYVRDKIELQKRKKSLKEWMDFKKTKKLPLP